MAFLTLLHSLDYNLLAGRLHPLLVHFPIALLLVGVAAAWVRVALRRPSVTATELTLVGTGTVGAGLACLTGWIFAANESDVQQLDDALAWHRWLGIAAAGFAAIACLLAILSFRGIGRLSRRWYVFMLTVCCMILGVASHFGASMVWGSNFLLEPFQTAITEAPTPIAPIAPIAATKQPATPSRTNLRLAPPGTILTVDYVREVQPIFAASCYECHGNAKMYGQLNLTNISGIFTGDQRFWVVHPGRGRLSGLVQRISRPIDADDRMPPVESPLPASSVALISRWIDEGAYEGILPSP